MLENMFLESEMIIELRFPSTSIFMTFAKTIRISTKAAIIIIMWGRESMSIIEYAIN